MRVTKSLDDLNTDTTNLYKILGQALQEFTENNDAPALVVLSAIEILLFTYLEQRLTKEEAEIYASFLKEKFITWVEI